MNLSVNMLLPLPLQFSFYGFIDYFICQLPQFLVLPLSFNRVIYNYCAIDLLCCFVSLYLFFISFVLMHLIFLALHILRILNISLFIFSKCFSTYNSLNFEIKHKYLFVTFNMWFITHFYFTSSSPIF